MAGIQVEIVDAVRTGTAGPARITIGTEEHFPIRADSQIVGITRGKKNRDPMEDYTYKRS